MPKTETIKIQDLNYYYKNPRRGDIEAIAQSLKTHGQYKTICVNKGTKTGRPLEILAGNHTIKAARTLGWETIQATIIDVDDEAAAKIVIADNRTSDLAENDPEVLIDLIESLTDLDGTGWADDELEELAQTISDLDPEPYDSGTEETYKTRFELVVECQDETHQEKLFNQLTSQGEKCRLLTL